MNTRKIISWVLVGLVALLMLASALMKFAGGPEVEAGFEQFRLGEHRLAIGVLEVVCVLLFIYPRTSGIGALMVTGYLGGAVVAHLVAGQPFYLPLLLGAVAWVATYLRRPAVFNTQHAY